MAIIEISSGNVKASSDVSYSDTSTGVKFFDRSDSFKWMKDDAKFKGEYVIVPSEGNVSVQYVKGAFSHHQKTYRISSDQDKLKTKYLYYFLLKNINKLHPIGTTVPRVNAKEWSSLINTAEIPNVTNQNEIIDIIEPVEALESSINNLKNKIISMLSIIGNIEVSPLGETIKYEKLAEKDFNEGLYVPTGSIGNFNDEIENVEYLASLPSRAKIKLLNDTLYISKLDGEKKFLYLNSISDQIIISNGMWGINAEESKKYSLYAYLLSSDFYLNKSALSTGTTMRGINDKSLNKIISSKKIDTSFNAELKELFIALSQVENLYSKIKSIKDKLIQLLIK